MKGKTVLKRKVNPKEDKPAVGEEYTQSKIIKGKISDDLLPEIYKSITADDIFLKKRENELGIKIQYVGNKPESYENLPFSMSSIAILRCLGPPISSMFILFNMKFPINTSSTYGYT